MQSLDAEDSIDAFEESLIGNLSRALGVADVDIEVRFVESSPLRISWLVKAKDHDEVKTLATTVVAYGESLLDGMTSGYGVLALSLNILCFWMSAKGQV